jgi:nitroreductase
MNSIFRRRSIRQYTPDPVSEEQLQLLLNAAMVAPSAGDQRPWHFVVIRDPKVLAQIPKVHPHAAMAPKASLCILVCGDEQAQLHPGYWIQDCSAATQNILLEATELGLGAVWLGVHPRPERIEGMRALFGLPAHISPLSLIAIGHPAEEKEPAQRFDPSRIHLNHW